jgi:hypothetical protein
MIKFATTGSRSQPFRQSLTGLAFCMIAALCGRHRPLRNPQPWRLVTALIHPFEILTVRVDYPISQ